LNKILTAVLAIALVVSGFWGYREHKEKQALLIKAETQYQRAFHDLSDHMNLLQDELGKSLAVNTKLQLTNSLTESWRLAAEARSDVGELPLTLMPFNNTMGFLNDLGNFSYKVAVRKENKQALSDSEWKTLRELYNRSKGLENQLGTLQTAVITKNLRWMDAETALAQTDKKTDNQIVDGFKAMETSVKNQKPISFGPTINAMQTRNKTDERKLTGSNVNARQAAQIAAQWLGLPNTNGVIVQRNGKGDQYTYPSYSVTATNPAKQKIYMTMTVKGGHVTNYMNNRDVPSESIDLSQGVGYAQKYLKERKIDATELIKTDTYDNVGVYEFVSTQNGIRLYPDKVVVKVALDNGEVVGLNAQDYEFHHVPRTIPQAKLTEAQARKFVSPHVKVEETHMAIVPNDLKQDELVYEFLGTMDNDTYKVYISAIDGDEVGVEKLK
jgi:spore germination protein